MGYGFGRDVIASLSRILILTLSGTTEVFAAVFTHIRNEFPTESQILQVTT